jgi:BirA family biotin operon repressor/biotin-[acetyl-CoA-carboxylase] ligase
MNVWLKSTPSTMIDAARLAGQGEPHGTVVVAEHQTEGIGRHGHKWHSAPGEGLYISIILRLTLPPDALPVLTMALGLAVQQAVNRIAGIQTDLRWPNDVILNEKKLAGTLVQQPQKDVFIAGIGINTGHKSFPKELEPIATSLLIETGREIAKEALLDAVLAAVLEHAALLESEGKAAILQLFETSSTYVRGKKVSVENRIHGVTAGLNADGFLLVETPHGVETILTGGVRAAS